MTRTEQIRRQMEFYATIIQQQEHLLKIYGNIRELGGTIPGGQETSIYTLLEMNKRRLAAYEQELWNLTGTGT